MGLTAKVWTKPTDVSSFSWDKLVGTPAEWDAFGSESCVSSENTKRGSGGSNSVLHPRNHHITLIRKRRLTQELWGSSLVTADFRQLLPTGFKLDVLGPTGSSPLTVFFKLHQNLWLVVCWALWSAPMSPAGTYGMIHFRKKHYFVTVVTAQCGRKQPSK